MHASRLTHAVHVVPFIGGVRTVAPGEVVDLEEVIGRDCEGAPLSLGGALTPAQLEQFTAVDEDGAPAKDGRKRAVRQPSEE